MKFSTHNAARRRRGFTLPEMMVALGIFAVAMIAMVVVQIFGLRVYNLSSTKLIATTSGRKIIDKIRDPIRSGSTATVGFYTNSFSPIAGGTQQIGNALKVFYTLTYDLSSGATTTNTVIFYRNLTNTALYYISTNNALTVVASNLANTLCFQAEDVHGNILTNSSQNNPVIRVALDFSQWEFPILSGSGNSSNNYHLETRVTPRNK